MLKNYLFSFLAMAYMPIMSLLTTIIFIVIFIFMDYPPVFFKTIVGILALALLIVLIKYNLDKASIKKQVRAIPNKEEYDDAVMLGKTLFCEDRFLVYTKGKCKEYSYSDVIKLTHLDSKKEKGNLVLKDREVQLPFASKEQGNKFSSFLKRKNPSIVLEGFNETNLNKLHDIDRA